VNTLISIHDATFDRLENAAAPWLLPTLARFTFAATLMLYFWNSGLTKLGSGIGGLFAPSLGAYAQIFPKAMEAVGYDVGQLGLFHRLVVLAGTYAEFLLPLLLLLGLATRLSALGMIGFIAVQSLTDLFGHGAIGQPETLGAWFDRVPDSPILDQRLFWITVLTVLVIRGAGPLSLDRLLRRHAPYDSSAA
jgi:putative oxidoreductase